MALIPAVGRRSWKARLFFVSVYLVLSLGAVTMVYPFLLMLGASVTSQYDQDRHDIIPRYLHSNSALFGKYAEDKYGGDFTKINAAYNSNFAKYEDINPPPAIDRGKVADWHEFVAALPLRYKVAGFGGSSAAFAPSPLLDRYHDYLRAHFHDNIAALDRSYTQEEETFLTVYPPFEQPTKHTWAPDQSVKTRDWAQFEATLPPDFFTVVRGDSLYQKWLKEEAYLKLDALNKAWGTAYKDWIEITLPARPIGNPLQSKDWETFVRAKMPFRFVSVSEAAASAYRAFLQTRYHGAIADYNAKYGASLASFALAGLPDPSEIPPAGPPLLDWLDFLKTAPLADIAADTVETRYRSFAATRYGLTSASAVVLPEYQADWQYVQTHGGALRRDFMARNYVLVLQYIALHGRAAFNTLIFCLLAVLIAVIINPLCAYAISRFNLPYANTVLLFVLATMAFPTEVAMIPNFLLLKQLGLLNTFAALVLPTAASGYSIFLLKGFFDSLPKELYEAGTMDGATEVRMFWNITLPLSKPIFAYIAYQSFVAAYGAFLFALITCQDPKMWTLTVWLYELQSSGAPEYVVLAGATLIAIPTLIAFIFAQRVIMKGIILPSFK